MSVEIQEPKTQSATLAYFVKSARDIWAYRSDRWVPIVNLGHSQVGDIFRGTDPDDEATLLPILDDDKEERSEYVYGLVCEAPIYNADAGVWTVVAEAAKTLEEVVERRTELYAE